MNDRKVIHLEEELEKVVGLVGDKIDGLKREFSNDFLEVMEIKEACQTALEVKVADLEERLTHTLTCTANLASLLLSVHVRNDCPVYTFFFFSPFVLPSYLHSFVTTSYNPIYSYFPSLTAYLYV